MSLRWKRVWRILAVVITLIVVVLFVDYYSRCHGKPLSREEALQRATAQLQHLSKNFVIGDPLPALVEEEYDATARTWILTYRGGACEVFIIADRCNGTDIGGISGGCKQR